MSIAYVQGSTHQNGGTSSTTVAVTLTGPIGSGHMVCVSVGWAGSSGADTITGITDDKGNTYTLVDHLHDSTDGYDWQSAYMLNVTNGAQTITATISTSRSFATILVDEFSGVATSSAIDGHHINNQVTLAAGTNSVTSTAITTTANGDLVYGSAVNITGGGTESAGTGFTLAQHTSGAFITEYQAQPTAGSIASTFTSTATSSWLTYVMAFKASSNLTIALATTDAQDTAHFNLGAPANDFRFAVTDAMDTASFNLSVLAQISMSRVPMTGV